MTRPLFDAFPALSSRIPFVPLAVLPTPVQAIDGEGKGWVKRDDLTHDRYGGNKVRKLEFIVGEWRQRDVEEVITFGATGTNAGLATAVACQQEGIRCRVLVFDQPLTPTVKENFAAMARLGVRFERWHSLAATYLAFRCHPRRLSPRHYFLFAGCSNPNATLAYVNAALELRLQIEEGKLPMPAEIVLPVGSGSTLAGLTLGVAIAGLPTRVIGVRVAPARVLGVPACTAGTVSRQMAEAARLLGGNLSLPPMTLMDDYFGAGYGLATPEATNAIRRFSSVLAAPLESTYSGKAAACFWDRLQAAAGPVLFWDTFNSHPVASLG